MKKALQISPLVLLMLTAVLWSTQGVLGKWNDWNSLTLVGFRGIVAAAVIGLYRKDFRVPRGAKNYIAAAAVALTALLFISATKMTSAANAVVLQYTMPVFVILYCAVYKKQMPKKADIACVILMLVGVVLCCFGELGGGEMLGNALSLVSAVMLATVYILGGSTACDTLGYTYLGNLFCILLIPMGLFEGIPVFDAKNIVSTVLMGLSVGLGYVLFSVAFMKKADTTKAAIISYIEPVMNPLLVFIFLDETPGLVGFIGIFIVLFTALAYSVITSRKDKN